MKLSGPLEILFFGNDANLLGGNKHTFCKGKGRGAISVDNKEFSLVENAQKKK